MEIRPILSSMLRNKTAPLLIAAQVALTLAIVCNALYIIRDRLATAARPTGADEQNLSEIRFYPHREISDPKVVTSRLAPPAQLARSSSNALGGSVRGTRADPVKGKRSRESRCDAASR